MPPLWAPLELIMRVTYFSGRLTLADIKLGKGSGILNISAWGNLTDEEYVTLSFPVGDAAFRTIQAYGLPRTAGIDVNYQF